MTIAPDTNVLVRAIVRDDKAQARQAIEVLRQARQIAISSACLCEVGWVLRSVYEFSRAEIAAAIDQLIAAESVVINRASIEAGLAVLRAGGDFSDGVLAFEGRWLGGETFISFDSKAVTLLQKQGYNAEIPS